MEVHMPSFEQEIKDLLGKHNVKYDDNSSSYSQPDFVVQLKGGHLFLEVKEKRQSYAIDKWPIDPQEEHKTFILDELTVRKLMCHTPSSGLAVRDNTTGLYYFADIFALTLMPRVRCNREMAEGVFKGKWVLNFSNFEITDSVLGIFQKANKFKDTSALLLRERVDCYKPYFLGEDVTTAGSLRTAEQKEYDVEATR
jgi:hypothetical protein